MPRWPEIQLAIGEKQDQITAIPVGLAGKLCKPCSNAAPRLVVCPVKRSLLELGKELLL